MDPTAVTIFGTSIAQAISQYGYFALLPLFVVEGTTVGFVSGILISLGVLSALPVFILYVLGKVISDTALFYVARSSTEWLKKVPFGKKLQKRKEAATNHVGTEWADRFRSHYFSLMMFGKVAPIPWVAEATVVTAGALKMQMKKVYAPIFIGQPIWSAMIIGLGYYFGDTIKNPNKLLSEAGVVFVLMAVLIGLYFYFAHARVKAYFHDQHFFFNGD